MIGKQNSQIQGNNSFSFQKLDLWFSEIQSCVSYMSGYPKVKSEIGNLKIIHSDVRLHFAVGGSDFEITSFLAETSLQKFLASSVSLSA